MDKNQISSTQISSLPHENSILCLENKNTAPKIEADILLPNIKNAAECAKNVFCSSLDFEEKRYNFDNTKFVYYQQDGDELKNIPYGTRTIGSYGCGPTNMAMVIATLAKKEVSPITLARLSEANGCFVDGSGTSYAFFGIAAKKYDVKMTSATFEKSLIYNSLLSGKYIICTMGPGIFSRGGHFIILRGVTADGKILIADSISIANSVKAWDFKMLQSQLKNSNVWIFGN
ncbi:MAG: papain-like cysteine protease family protein [Clostridia bacterium]